MRLLCILFIAFVSCILDGCSSRPQVSGRYTNIFPEVAGQELNFTNRPDSFVYYSIAEGTVISYSSGGWALKNRTVFLNGFTEENIRALAVNSKVEHRQDDKASAIVVQFKANELDTFIKVDITVNKTISIRIISDTLVYVGVPIKTVQAKCYLVHPGVVFQSPLRIDTLYSQQIALEDQSKQKNRVYLTFEVSLKDFYRSRVKDTLTVKNSRTLIWQSREFKRVK